MKKWQKVLKSISNNREVLGKVPSVWRLSWTKSQLELLISGISTWKKWKAGDMTTTYTSGGEKIYSFWHVFLETYCKHM